MTTHPNLSVPGATVDFPRNEVVDILSATPPQEGPAAMTTTTAPNPYPNVPLPAGAVAHDDWESDGDRRYRMIFGPNHAFTDCEVALCTDAIQLDDGSIDTTGHWGTPRIYVDADNGLDSDQARELASALLETADQLDGWTR